MERESMIKVKGGFTERMLLAKEYTEWLEKEGNKARCILANNPQTMIAFLQTKGWREVPEGSVVLTGIDKGTTYAKVTEGEIVVNKKQFADLALENGVLKKMNNEHEEMTAKIMEACQKAIEEAKEQVRKETAREILREFSKLQWGQSELDNVCIRIAEKYGVEVEE